MANRRQGPVSNLQDQRRQRTRSAPKTDGSAPIRDPEAILLPPENDDRAITELPREIPLCPAGLQVHVRNKWEVFWASPLAQFVIQFDRVTILERYFRTLDMNDRAYTRFMRGWYTKGSTGQKVLSPDWQIYRESSRLLDTLEDQLGVGSRARMRLNIEFGEAAESLADFLKALRAGVDTDDEPGEMIEIGPDGEYLP